MAGVNGGKDGDRQVEVDDEDSMNMLDVLAEEQQLEDDADAVLGDSDDKNCTYQMGYVKRQALYACLTCTPPSSRPAGVCLACSFECHEGHDLCELYTKRKFKCDCGNSRFPEMNCKLNPIKQGNNVDNKYNQNFRGLYCSCHRPYPDPEDDVEDEMIQCVTCEDWYHGRHLGSSAPLNSDYSEMICGGCMERLPFLCYYNVTSTEIRLKTADTEGSVDVEQNSQPVSLNTTESPTKSPNRKSPEKQSHADKENGNIGKSSPGKSPNTKKTHNGIEKGESSASQQGTCLLQQLKHRQLQAQAGAATYWPDSWREKLCRCMVCMDMYVDKEVEFLTEESDTVKAYEERGKANRASGSQYDRGMQVLSHMDRIQQVEVLHEYNDLKSELKEYLKKFAENGKVVREEDIREFFTQMQGRKRQRTTSQMVYNCR